MLAAVKATVNQSGNIRDLRRIRSSWSYHAKGICVDQNNRDLPTAYRAVVDSRGLHGFIRASGQSPAPKQGSIHLQLPHRTATAFGCQTRV